MPTAQPSPGPIPGPDPEALYAIPGFRNTVFLKPLLCGRYRNVSVGEFSYYSDFHDPLPFFERNLRYNFGFSGARFEVGRYCAIAHGATFVMDDANHATVGPSSFPFPVFGGAWADAMAVSDMPIDRRGDIRIGHDVWIGYEALILPGVRIGHGAIVGARAVVSRDVPDYAVVAGNPAQVVRTRFDTDTVARLLSLRWWDWPPSRVAAAVPLLIAGEVGRLEAFSAEGGDMGTSGSALRASGPDAERDD